MPDDTFDLEKYRRERLRELDARCRFLEGERDRLERILAAVLTMAARTINQDPMLILDAAITVENIHPGYAAIHEPTPPPEANRRSHVAA